MRRRKPATRRDFLKHSGAAACLAVAGSRPLSPLSLSDSGLTDPGFDHLTDDNKSAARVSRISFGAPDRLNLSPAHWIWFPSERTLPNTFVLFRREVQLSSAPISARGWITADSRYRLRVNGRRIQWGPGPCDPRWMDVDPMDLTPHLQPGLNVIGIEVVYFGFGDGTCIAGKPGLIARLEIDFGNGRVENIISDGSWQVYLDRAHRVGQYKRWYLRALQEEFDARLRPQGWDLPGFAMDRDWAPATIIDAAADKPVICGHYLDYLENKEVPDDSACFLRPRDIPLAREFEVSALRLAESGRVEWLRDPLDWFEFRMPNSFRVGREPVAQPQPDGSWRLPATPGLRAAAFATFEFKEEIVGFPYFTIDAPEGTIVESIYQESHDPSRAAWLDTSFYCWSRFVCREGVNHFEVFDYEALRWLQLHVRNASRPVIIQRVGVRRRVYDWPHELSVRCSEPALQRLIDACVNTLQNGIQDNVPCELVRERQQYCAQAGQPMHTVRYGFGETRLPRRFLRTFSEGLTPGGYFIDPWPASDSLTRIGQREFGATIWAAGILDEDLLFFFDCWDHYLHTGDLEAVREPYPRLLRFTQYVEQLRGTDGLLPVVENPDLYVWLDDFFNIKQKTRSGQCALNLIAAASFQYGIAPLARAFGDVRRAERLTQVGKEIESAAVRRFWSAERGLFVDNLPWLREDGKPLLYDKTLALSILFDLCPGINFKAASQALVTPPPEMHLTYTYETYWRFRALAKLGRGDVVVRDLREKWANLRSVRENNTVPEYGEAKPDSQDVWSDTYSVVPLYLLFIDIAGIVPTKPGFARCQVRPQLGDLAGLELTAHTVRGPIQFAANREENGHRVSLTLPQECECELLLPAGVPCELPPILPDHPSGLKRFRLKSGQTNTFSTREGRV